MDKNKTKKHPAFLVIISVIAVSFIIFWFLFQKSLSPQSQPAAEKVSTQNNETKIFFASDGKNSVYKIKKGDKWSVIWNGQEGKEYDDVSDPVFSQDGSQLAYNATLDGQSYVVVNNALEINAYQGASYIVFSQDGSTIAFVAEKNGTSVVITSQTIPSETPVSGQESDSFDQIGTTEDDYGNAIAIVLSSDGSQVAYTIIEDGKIYVVINGEKSETGFDSVSDLTLQNDGTYSYEATDGENNYSVVNDVITEVSDDTTPDSGDDSSDETSLPDSSDNETTDTINSSEPYPYKISTQKDIDRSGDDNESDYTGCPPGGSCNF